MHGYTHRPKLGIALITLGIIAISINDMLVKWLSAGYPLHEIVAVRSAIGLIILFVILRFDGGVSSLRTSTPLIHILRGLCIVCANLTFFAALAVMPLAQVTALFFVAPLFITLLSVPILKERIELSSGIAVLVGFAGVLIMQQPWSSEPRDVPTLVFFLPMVAAFMYALTQVLSRRLGVTTRATAMAIYTQVLFLVVCLGMFTAAGDGRFAEAAGNDSLTFILGPWIMPPQSDFAALILLGVFSAIAVFCLTQAYRQASAAVIAPFEYIGMPMAITLGWLVFGEWPEIEVWIGCALIIGAGLFVLLHQHRRAMVKPV